MSRKPYQSINYTLFQTKKAQKPYTLGRQIFAFPGHGYAALKYCLVASTARVLHCQEFQINLNVTPNYLMIPLVAIKYEEISILPKCTVVLTFRLWMGGCKNLILIVRLQSTQAGKSRSHVFFLLGPPPSRMFLFAQRFDVFCDPAAVPSLFTANSLQRTPTRTPRRGPRLNLVPRAFP